jgi:hypothetical protein
MYATLRALVAAASKTKTTANGRRVKPNANRPCCGSLHESAAAASADAVSRRGRSEIDNPRLWLDSLRRNSKPCICAGTVNEGGKNSRQKQQL